MRQSAIAQRIDPSSIRAIGIDLMDTVIADPWRQIVEEISGRSIAELSTLRDAEVWGAFERGEISEDEYGGRFFRRETGLSLDARALGEAILSRSRFIDGMEQLCLDLARRRPLYILSNYPEWYEGMRRRFALDRFAVGHFPSSRLGLRKPDAAYFLRVLAEVGLEREELLFIDDREENVGAARALGLPALQFKSSVELRRDLSPLLD